MENKVSFWSKPKKEIIIEKAWKQQGTGDIGPVWDWRNKKVVSASRVPAGVTWPAALHTCPSALPVAIATGSALWKTGLKVVMVGGEAGCVCVCGEESSYFKNAAGSVQKPHHISLTHKSKQWRYSVRNPLSCEGLNIRFISMNVWIIHYTKWLS